MRDEKNNSLPEPHLPGELPCTVAASSPPAILLLLLLLLFLLAPRTPQLQLPNTVLGAGDKHASVRDKKQIPSTKNTRITHVVLC